MQLDMLQLLVIYNTCSNKKVFLGHRNMIELVD